MRVGRLTLPRPSAAGGRPLGGKEGGTTYPDAYSRPLLPPTLPLAGRAGIRPLPLSSVAGPRVNHPPLPFPAPPAAKLGWPAPLIPSSAGNWLVRALLIYFHFILIVCLLVKPTYFILSPSCLGKKSFACVFFLNFQKMVILFPWSGSV